MTSILQEVTPEEPHKAVRRSARNKLGPKRLSYSPHREETHDIKKRVGHRRNAQESWRLQFCAKKKNNLNKFCLQKIKKNHKHNLQQINEDEEDENIVVDQTVSIRALYLNYLMDFIHFEFEFVNMFVVKSREVMGNFQNMN